MACTCQEAENDEHTDAATDIDSVELTMGTISKAGDASMPTVLTYTSAAANAGHKVGGVKPAFD